MPTNRRLEGTVTARNFGGTVECPDAPETHLRIHNLVPVQMKGAQLGDKVELEYRIGPNHGLWFVVTINGVSV